MSISVGGGLGVRISGGIVVGPSVGVSLSGNDYAVYLLRDDFTTAEAAPLASPRTAEPGPGTLTITDTENKLSISGGEMVVAGGKASPADGDPGAWGQQLARVAGRAHIFTFTMTGGQYWQAGWDTNQAGASIYGVAINGTAVRAITSTLQNIGTIANDTAYHYAVVLRATGYLIFIKGGAYTSWTLLWVGENGTDANLYSSWANYNATGALG